MTGLYVRGFKFDNIVIKLTVKDVPSLKRLMKLMKGLELFSSLKMNVEKCKACWIGNS